MKRVLLACMAVAACSSPEPGIEVRTVEVPVPLACVSQERLAEAVAGEPPRVASELTGDANADLAIVAASALELRAWAFDLLGIVKGCAVAP